MLDELVALAVGILAFGIFGALAVYGLLLILGVCR